MIRFLAATAAGCALFAAALTTSTTANAVPSGPPSVDQTVASLQMHGYTVIVNGAGSAPLDQCTTYAVRPGQTFTRMDSGFPGAGNDIVSKVVSMTVYLDAHC